MLSEHDIESIYRVCVCVLAPAHLPLLLDDVGADSRGSREDMRCSAICRVSSATKRASKTRTLAEEQRTLGGCGAFS